MARLAQRGERQRVDWPLAASRCLHSNLQSLKSKRQAHNLFIGSKLKAKAQLPSFAPLISLIHPSSQHLHFLCPTIVQTAHQIKFDPASNHPNILQLNRLQIESSSSVVFCYEWYQPCRPIVLRSKAKARGRACPKESICSTSQRQMVTFVSSSTRPTKVASLT